MLEPIIEFTICECKQLKYLPTLMCLNIWKKNNNYIRISNSKNQIKKEQMVVKSLEYILRYLLYKKMYIIKN